MLPPLIGLCGKAGAGKSTAAAYLAARFGYEAVHIGRPMKAMLRALLVELGYTHDLADRYIDGDLKRTLIPELRVTATRAQQTLGTEWGRSLCHADLWLEAWLAKVGGRLAINESVRFRNEADAMRARGGVIIEIRRPGLEFASDHVSEAMPFAPDFRIWNDGPVTILHKRLEGLIERTAQLAAANPAT